MLNIIILISTETLVRQNINIQIPTFEYHVGQRIIQELERFINVWVGWRQNVKNKFKDQIQL